MKKADYKKSAEELQEYLMFRRRGFKVEARKGKGSYKRKLKHKNKDMACSTKLVQVPTLSRQICQFEPGTGHHISSGVEQMVAHQVHTLEVVGSSPTSATIGREWWLVHQTKYGQHSCTNETLGLISQLCSLGQVG